MKYHTKQHFDFGSDGMIFNPIAQHFSNMRVKWQYVRFSSLLLLGLFLILLPFSFFGQFFLLFGFLFLLFFFPLLLCVFLQPLYR